MRRHTCITLDQGPGFIGWSGVVGETAVCVMTPKVRTDAATARVARQLIQRQGGDCAACSLTDCPLTMAAPA